METVGQALIKTKFFTPRPRPSLVRRTRLVEKLRQASEYPLTLICAPAGYGKTTLLAEWIAARFPEETGPGENIAWLSLDGGDNDPQRFLAYLLAAIEKARPGALAETQLMLQSPQPFPLMRLLPVLINELQELERPLWLVLDDYQFISNPTIHEGVALLLERQPGQFHVLIATRSDPPLSLYRLRARNQMLEIRAGDLRFSLEETAEFLNRVMQLALSPQEVGALESRTEGWIAGLQMAALSLQGKGNRADFIRDFGGSQRYILEYLMEEVLKQQPDAIQVFLLHTSILDRLCRPLCAALMQAPGDGQDSLSYLERANLFLIPLDDRGYWYRYHHLFADLLRARLIQAQADIVAELHLRASRWYEQEGWPQEAVEHALAAGDLERAARLVEVYTMEILNRGEMAALLAFIQALPEDVIRQHPLLCIQHAWALTFTGQIGLVENRLRQAEAHIRPDHASPRDREILGSAAIIRGLIADFMGDLPAAVELARKADELISAGELQARSVIPYVLGDGYLAQGDLEQAGQAYAKIREIGRISGNLWTNEVALYKMALVKRLQGKLHAAWDLYQEAMQLAIETDSQRSGSMGATYVGMSELQYGWNQLEAARETGIQAVHVMAHWPDPVDMVNAYVSLARVELAQGNIIAADAAITKAEEISRQGRLFPVTVKHLEGCRLRFWLAKGDLAAVHQWLQTQSFDEMMLAVRKKADHVSELGGLLLARGLLVQGPGGIEKARQLLEPLAENCRSKAQIGTLIEVLVLAARVWQARGDPAAARKALMECLRLAEPEGYLRVFLDEGEEMKEILEACLSLVERSKGSEESKLTDYLRDILAAFPDRAMAGAPAGAIRAGQESLIEPLSQRELEVLELICKGCTNLEIAEKLVVTLNTVKKHNNRIFGKLGVTSRVQAVLRAKSLGLAAEVGSEG